MPVEPNVFLVQTELPEQVTAIRHALTAAGIPYDTGLQDGPPARVSFFVPLRRLEDARASVGSYLDGDEWDRDEDEGVDETTPADAWRFPWGPLEAVGAVSFLQLAVVLWTHGSLPLGSRLIELGGLIPGLTLQEPWRLLTSVFLHGDLRHLGWNTLSMAVFAVPLIAYLGYGRAGVVYLLSGIGGGFGALLFSQPGVVTIGSSGAVAGLFGAWVVATLRRARRETFSGRATIRTLGVALLVLPSLLNPTTASGQPISIGAHLGGLATGMLVGALLSTRMRLRTRDDAVTDGA